MIDASGNKGAAICWRSLCYSETAFIKTWLLSRAIRRLALLAAKNKKTEAHGAARGYVIARHAVVAIEKFAKKIKAQKSRQLITDFIYLVSIAGAWAARAAAGVIDIQKTILRKRRGDWMQKELFCSFE